MASGKNAAVITTWNQIAVTTLMNTVPPPAGPAASPTHFIYYAFTHLAMHNAVNGIAGKYRALPVGCPREQECVAWRPQLPQRRIAS